MPSITLHWLNILTKIFPSKNIKYTVGDCSGSFRGRRYYPDLRHVPFINLEHGVKIDIFIRKVCNSEFILICDDDIFLIDRSPIDWALDKLKSNKKLAAVSLFPRPEYKKRLNDYFKLYDGINLRKDISRLMGSYCIIIRRDIWIRENLYFQQVKPENWKDVGNFFDTADYSNLKLIELGYKIEFAPKSLQNKLIFFSSLSLWGIKIQSTLGNIHEAIKPRPGEYEKAYQTAVSIINFNEIIRKRNYFNNTSLFPNTFLTKTIEICKKNLKKNDLKVLTNNLKKKFKKINQIEKMYFINKYKSYG